MALAGTFHFIRRVKQFQPDQISNPGDPLDKRGNGAKKTGFDSEQNERLFFTEQLGSK
jgi:hypothetical protein